MHSKILFIIRYFIFWLMAAIASRLFFLCYQNVESLTWGDIANTFIYGFWMDLSLSGYMTMLATIVLLFFGFVCDGVMRKILNVLTSILLFVFWLIAISDAELFANWGYHADASVLTYLKTPKEAIASTSASLLITLFLSCLIIVILFDFLYKKLIVNKLKYEHASWMQTVAMLLMVGVLFIPIRGGFNVAPMNTSFVFFHKTNMLANLSAVNGVWNFIYEMSHAGNFSKKYNYMPSDEARQLVDELYISSDKTVAKLLKIEKPNIILILLESFTADAIEPLGGAKGVTPRLNQLIKEGVLFDSIYATGNRSDRGISGVISGQPSHPNFSIIKYPGKMAGIPRMSSVLENDGYSTRFYYAGDLNFGGFRSYITMSFREMITEDDFDGEAIQNRFKWGVHDQYMFSRLAEDVHKAQQPFMYMAFNMSSHEPFDVPMQTQISGEAERERMLNAIYYADQSLGILVDSLKQNGQWNNTLLVLVADHGTIKIENRQSYQPEAFRIPFVLTGGAMAVCDSVIHTLGSQTDVVATLLAQLNLPTVTFKYSKNLLANSAPFAFYSFSNTAGVVTPRGTTVLNLRNNTFIISADTTDERILKAYLQVLDDDVN